MIKLFTAASTNPVSAPFTVVNQVTVYAHGLVFGDEIQFETVAYAEGATPLAAPSAEDPCIGCLPNPTQVVTGTARLTCCGCSCPGADYPVRLTADTPFVIIDAPQNVYIRAVYIGGNLGDFNVWTEQTATANVTDSMRGCCHPPEVDVAVAKTTPKQTPRVGEATSYSILVTNSGPAPANGTLIKDAIPEGMTVTGITVTYANGAVGAATLTPAQLAAGYSIPVFPVNGAATITVSGNFSRVGAYLNRAVVFAPDGTVDTKPENNESEVLVNVTPNVSDVSVTKTTSNASPRVGEVITYTVVATNAGPQDADGMVLTDALPAAFFPTGITVGYAGGAAGPATITASALATGVGLPTMPAGASVTATITGSFATVGSYQNTAGVKPPPGRADGDLLNNTATVTNTVVANVADVWVTKAADAESYAVGDTVTYTVTFGNLGPQDADGAVLTDALPSTLTNPSVAVVYTGGASTTVAPTPALLASGWVVATLPSGGGGVLTITGLAGTSGSLTNQATIKAPNGRTDPNPGNNLAITIVTVQPPALVDICGNTIDDATAKYLVEGSLKGCDDNPITCADRLKKCCDTEVRFTSLNQNIGAGVCIALSNVTYDPLTRRCVFQMRDTTAIEGGLELGPNSNPGAHLSYTWTNTTGCDELVTVELFASDNYAPSNYIYGDEAVGFLHAISETLLIDPPNAANGQIDPTFSINNISATGNNNGSATIPNVGINAAQTASVAKYKKLLPSGASFTVYAQAWVYFYQDHPMPPLPVYAFFHANMALSLTGQRGALQV